MANEFIARRGLIVLNGASVTGSLQVQGTISGSVVSGTFSGNGAGVINVISSSFANTSLTTNSASFASNALTANTSSYALVAGSVVGGTANATSASYALSASMAQTALTANSASYAPTDWNAVNNRPVGILTSSAQINLLVGVSASYSSQSLSSSFASNALTTNSASFASNALTANSASFATTASAATSITFVPATASFATTASFAPTLWANIIGTPVGILTSSAQINLLVGVTASFASQSLSSSFASNALTANSASFASNALTANSASFATTASAATSITFVPASASFAGTDWSAINNRPVGILTSSAQINLLTGVTASFASRSLSASYANTDWSGIANIPIGIVTASAQVVTAINGQNVTLGAVTTSNLWVNGTVTATQFNTQFVSSSIIFQSGSTKFGDTSDDVMNVTGTLAVSGGANITGLATFNNGIQTGLLNGSFFATSSTVVNIGTTPIALVPTTSFDSAHFDYIAKNGLNYRAGTVIAVWSASVVEFTEYSTADIGNTADISFTVDILNSARLRAVVGTTNGWVVKTIIRGI